MFVRNVSAHILYDIGYWQSWCKGNLMSLPSIWLCWSWKVVFQWVNFSGCSPCFESLQCIGAVGSLTGRAFGLLNYQYCYNWFMDLWILSGTIRVSRYQKIHSPTHTYRGHQSSLICLLNLLSSMAWHPPCSIYVPDSLFAQLSPSFLWSTSWSGTLHFILRTFLHPIIVFFLRHISIPLQPVLQ